MSKVIINSLTLFVMLFVLFTPLTIHAESQIPEWVKINAGWWSDDTIDDNTFIHGIEYLIKENTITVSEIKKVESNYSLIPEWVKINAGLWADGDVDEKTFLNSLEFLIKNGIISAMVEKDFLDPNSWLTFNLVKQGIGEIPQGYTAIIFDKGFVYFSPRLNSFGYHGEVLRYDTTQDFQSADAWSTFDASKNGVGYDADGYTGIISDGHFLYFTPYFNGDEFHGEVLRYDTTQDFQSADAWSTFDASKNGVGYDATGYFGGTFDGRFVYFSPDWNDDEEGNPLAHGEVLRYDTTQDFQSADAWSTFDASKNGVGYNPVEYLDAVFVEKYVYFTPYHNGTLSHGEVLRYDTTQDFQSADAWSTFDASKNGVGYDATGFSGLIFDGTFIYFSPRDNASGSHGEVLRYDTTQDFQSADAWSTFDASKNGVGYDATGYFGGTFDGRFVYFSPNTNTSGSHGEVLRYDTTQDFQSADAWSTFDASKHNGYFPSGYLGMIFDGQFIYYSPHKDVNDIHHTEFLRYDTTSSFDTIDSWEFFKPSAKDIGFGTIFGMFTGGTFDGQFIYYSPAVDSENTPSEILRYDTTQDFQSADAWSTFDASKNGVGNKLNAFSDAIFVGEYVYFTPWYNNSYDSGGEVLRYDTTQDFQSADAWSVLNTVELTGNEKAVGFGNPYFDDGFIYLPPESGGTFLKINVFSNSFDELTIGTGSNPLDIVDIEKSGKYLFFISKSHGTVLRYDTTQDFESADSWTSFNLKTVGNNLRYYAMSTDGNSIYFSPYMSEKFLKLKLYD